MIVGWFKVDVFISQCTRLCLQPFVDFEQAACSLTPTKNHMRGIDLHNMLPGKQTHTIAAAKPRNDIKICFQIHSRL